MGSVEIGRIPLVRQGVGVQNWLCVQRLETLSMGGKALHIPVTSGLIALRNTVRKRLSGGLEITEGPQRCENPAVCFRYRF